MISLHKTPSAQITVLTFFNKWCVCRMIRKHCQSDRFKINSVGDLVLPFKRWGFTVLFWVERA